MSKRSQSWIGWVPAPMRIPNALEAWSLAFWAGLVLYVPSALKAATAPGEPAFIGPFKGGTRATGCLWHGDVLAALRFNPLAVALVVVISLGVLRWLLVLVLGRRPVMELGRRGNLVLVATAVVVLAANWIYVAASESWRAPYPY